MRNPQVRHSDEALAVASEHEAEADKPEEERAEHEVDEVLEQYVGGVLAACETSLAECETRLHEEYQHGCQQHPYGIE